MDVLEARLAEKVRYRRHRAGLARAKARAYRIAKVIYPCPDVREESWDEVFAARDSYVLGHYRNRVRCSAWWFGHNMRRYAKGDDAVTLQERRQDFAEADAG